MLLQANINLDSFLRKNLSVYVVFILLKQDNIFFINVRDTITHFILFLEFNSNAFSFEESMTQSSFILLSFSQPHSFSFHTSCWLHLNICSYEVATAILSGLQYEVYIQYQLDVKTKLDIAYFQHNWFMGWSVPNKSALEPHIINC